ncbi:MAG: c-type cytochrome biogenesis protein CcmI [Alphaproteobacteria bacterium]|nr:c-type cytochrome biogenesis protein CcmI [Alphaproteobacteria bacterium]
MTLALVLGVMALAAVALLAVPLLGKRARIEDRAAFDRAVFRDQLDELDRDLERGIIGAEDAQAARTEIERRILLGAGKQSAGDQSGGMPGTDDGTPGQGFSRLARIMIAVLIILVPALGGGLYVLLGRPELPDQPLAQRLAQRTGADTAPKGMSQEKFKAMVAKVESRLKANPDELPGWIILSTAYLRLGRDEDAEKAVTRALTLAAGDKNRAAGIAVNYGEALTAMNEGQIVPRAAAAFKTARALAPKHPTARYYMGLARLQAGDAKAALAIWNSLLADAPPGAPWFPSLQKRVERVAKEQGINLESLRPAPKR